MNETSRYEIVIRGRVGPRLLARLVDDFSIDGGEGTTRLVGEIRDPAHLHGVIAHLTALAVELVSIRPADDDVAAGRAPLSSNPSERTPE